MANKIQGDLFSVPMADGSRKRIHYKWSKMTDLEEVLDMSPMEVLSSGKGGNSFKFVQGMVWAGMQGAGSRDTLEQVGDNLDMRYFEEYTKTCLDALCIALHGKTVDELLESQKAKEAESDGLEIPLEDLSEPTST